MRKKRAEIDVTGIIDTGARDPSNRQDADRDRDKAHGDEQKREPPRVTESVVWDREDRDTADDGQGSDRSGIKAKADLPVRAMPELADDPDRPADTENGKQYKSGGAHQLHAGTVQHGRVAMCPPIPPEG